MWKILRTKYQKYLFSTRKVRERRTLHCPKNFFSLSLFFFFFFNKSLILPADQKKKECEKDIGRVEVMLAAVDRSEEERL
jgi:hypothetical protein